MHSEEAYEDITQPMHFPDVTSYCIKLKALRKYVFRSKYAAGFYLTNFFMKTDISLMASLISRRRYSSVIAPQPLVKYVLFITGMFVLK